MKKNIIIVIILMNMPVFLTAMPESIAIILAKKELAKRKNGKKQKNKSTWEENNSLGIDETYSNNFPRASSDGRHMKRHKQNR
jgi:hypothetical protein